MIDDHPKRLKILSGRIVDVLASSTIDTQKMKPKLESFLRELVNRSESHSQEGIEPKNLVASYKLTIAEILAAPDVDSSMSTT